MQPTLHAMALLLTALAVGQQTPAAGPSFETASVRPADTSGQVHAFRFQIEPNRLTVVYYNISSLLEEAYRLEDYQLKLVNAKDPVFDERFDIQAVAGAPVSDSEMRARLAQLLKDRFHVVSHWEEETIPMYRLEALPGGVQLKHSDTGYPGANSPMGTRGTCVEAFTGPMSMPQLSQMLTRWITRPKPVVDHTGADGYFLLDGFKFLQPACVPTVDSADGESPTDALKRIGLKLTPANDPIKVLVVDRAGPVEAN